MVVPEALCFRFRVCPHVRECLMIIFSQFLCNFCVTADCAARLRTLRCCCQVLRHCLVVPEALCFRVCTRVRECSMIIFSRFLCNFYVTADCAARLRTLPCCCQVLQCVADVLRRSVLRSSTSRAADRSAIR